MASAPTDEGDAGQVNKTLNLDSVKEAGSAASSGGHQTTVDARHAPIQVDYVIVFSLSPPAGSKASRASHAQSLQHEYRSLLENLKGAGLYATGRPGRRGKNEVLVLVKASDYRVKEEVEKERLTDWLHGITSTTPAGKKKRDFASEPYTPAERLRHVHNIITHASPSGNSDPRTSHDQVLAGPGAGILPNSSQFPHVVSIFPPHDPEFNRKWLKRWSDRGHVQIPDSEVDELRAHFGEAIAFYFAFLRSYFRSLVVPTVIGSAIWLLGWEYSPLYSVCLVLWATGFVELWSAKEKLLAAGWNTLGCGKVEKKRKEFLPATIEKDPVTGEQTGQFPWWKREARTLMTVPILFTFVAVLSGMITSITGVELLVNEVYDGPGKRYLSLLPTILFVALVPQLVSLWQTVALRLVAWENHTHESSYSRSLTLKMFALNIVPAYMGLILTAFVYIPFGSLLIPYLASIVHSLVKKDKVPGVAGKHLDDKSFDWSSYEINGNRLHAQILAYTVTNQIINAFTEIGLPIIMRFVGGKVAEMKGGGAEGKRGDGSAAKGEKPMPDADDEKAFLQRIREEASLPEYTLFVDYAEMVVQFGYVVVWTVVWPIAPLFAFINNFFELRGDALKLSTQCRRPIPVRTDTIGPWKSALGFLTWFAALVNAGLIYLFRPAPDHPASTSGFIAKAIKGEPLVHQNASAPEKATAFVTSHIGRAMQAVTGGDGDSGLGESPYYALRGVLFSALLVALASEHAYFIARWSLQHVFTRAYWVGSEAEVKQRQAEWDLKRSFLGTLNLDTKGHKLVRGDTVESVRDLSDPTEGETNEEGRKFWGRPDAGYAEVQRTTKTE